MFHLKSRRVLLGATALTVPLAFGSALAQQQQDRSGLEGACEQLHQLVQQSEQAGEDLLQEFRQAPQVAEANEAEACVLMIEKVETAGGITAAAQERDQGATVMTDTDSFSATDTVRQTVEIEQQAVVEGQVTVRQPIPEIGIEQGAPEIEVAQETVDVNIQEQPAQITIRQKPANVRVQIPQPSITIEQPAPEIVITMPPPGVSLERQQPRVSVNMPEPNVTVSQAEPEVTADVDARFVSGDELAQIQQGNQPQISTQTERTGAGGQPVEGDKQAEVTVRQAEARVSIQPPQEEGQVRVTPAEPRVVYEPSEPNVEVTFAENADVQVQQVGEPTVRIEREGEQQAAAQGQQGQAQAAMQEQPQQGQQQPQQAGQQPQQAEQQAAAQAGGQQAEGAFREDVQAVEGQEAERTAEQAARTPEDMTALLAVQEGAETRGGELMQVTAADLDGRDVVTLRGEQVGEIEGIYQNGDRLYAVIAHGGFLGIGENQIAIPAERIAVQGDQVVLLGLTEEQLEQMPEYNFETDQEVASSEVVQIGRSE